MNFSRAATREFFADNPILRRELLLRWKHWRCMVPLLGINLLGSALTLLCYFYALETSTAQDMVGAVEYFTPFAMALCVFLIAILIPDIAGSTLSRDRESGMLEQMQLSWLTPRKIIASKLAAALTYSALVLLTTFPVLLPVLLLDNREPGQLLAAFFLMLLTGLVGAIAGLSAACWSHTVLQARRNGNAIIAWGLGVSYLSEALSAVFDMRPFGIPDWLARALSQVTHVAGTANPVQFCWDEMQAPHGWEDWLCVVAVHLVAALTLWHLAVRALERPRDVAPLLSRVPSRSGKTQSNRLFSDIRFLTFSNPVLAREVQSRFRMRKPPRLVIVVEVVLAILVLAFYLFTLFSALTERNSREPIWGIATYATLGLTLLWSATVAGGSVAREREAGTWEPLSLSPYPVLSVCLGKVLAPVVSALILSVPAWILLLACALGELLRGDIATLGNVLLFAPLYLAASFFSACFGLCISTFYQKSAQAVSMSGLSFALWLVLVHALLTTLSFLDVQPVWTRNLAWLLSPFLSLSSITDWETRGFFGQELLTAISLLAQGWLLLRCAASRIAREWRLPSI